MVSARSCKKVSLCLTETLSDRSKTSTPLAKVEPIRDGDSASLITYLRRGKCYCAKAVVPEMRGVRIYERSSSEGTKVKEGKVGGAPGARGEILLQPVGKSMAAELVTTQGTHTEAACSRRTAFHEKGLMLEQFVRNSRL